MSSLDGIVTPWHERILPMTKHPGMGGNGAVVISGIWDPWWYSQTSFDIRKATVKDRVVTTFRKIFGKFTSIFVLWRTFINFYFWTLFFTLHFEFKWYIFATFVINNPKISYFAKLSERNFVTREFSGQKKWSQGRTIQWLWPWSKSHASDIR
jgi:hypothetical protein